MQGAECRAIGRAREGRARPLTAGLIFVLSGFVFLGKCFRQHPQPLHSFIGRMAVHCMLRDTTWLALESVLIRKARNIGHAYGHAVIAGGPVCAVRRHGRHITYIIHSTRPRHAHIIKER